MLNHKAVAPTAVLRLRCPLGGRTMPPMPRATRRHGAGLRELGLAHGLRGVCDRGLRLAND